MVGRRERPIGHPRGEGCQANGTHFKVALLRTGSPLPKIRTVRLPNLIKLTPNFWERGSHIS